MGIKATHLIDYIGISLFESAEGGCCIESRSDCILR